MPYQRNYPRTADEVLDPPVVFKQSVIDAVTNFKTMGAWTGNLQEKFAKFQTLNDSLNEVYGLNVALINDIGVENDSPGSSGSSYFNPSLNEIHLQGRLSVVTFLHEYAHALDKDERDAVRWSLNLFRQVFPTQFAALGRQGHVVVVQRVVPVVEHVRGV